jgi:hypothetical protein
MKKRHSPAETSPPEDEPSSPGRDSRKQPSGPPTASDRTPETDVTLQPKKLISRTETAVFLALAVLLALCHLRVLLNAGALWRDEVHSLNIATMPTVGKLWSSLSLESFPVFSLLVLRAWTTLVSPENDFALRVLGMGIGLGICGALFWNSRLSGRTLPLVSFALFALNPVTLRYGDSVRAYGLGVLLMLITFNLLWRVADAPTFRKALFAIILAILSVHTLYQNAFMLAGMCAGGAAVGLRRRQWHSIWWLLAIGVVAGLSLLPYAPVMAKLAEVKNSFQIKLSPGLVWEKLGGTLRAGGGFAFCCWLCLPVAAVARATAAQFARRDAIGSRERDLLLYAAVATLVGVAGFAVFLYTLSFPSQTWYYLLPLALVACLMDLVLGFVRAAGVRLVLRVLILAAMVSTLVSGWSRLDTRHTNFDSLARQLEKESTSRDLIVLTHWYGGITFGRYYHGPAKWTTLPPLEDYHLQRLDLVKQKTLEEKPIESVLQSIAGTLKSGGRIWLVGGFHSPPRGEKPPVLRPAPDPKVGWWSEGYLASWILQTGSFLQSHALHGRRVAIEDGAPVDYLEAPQLWAFQGWQDE